ncbi:alpha/beta-hydrolase [Earliella scabrosa]|nr:alpha/beta-hydrolase [Earliella scabrosa]
MHSDRLKVALLTAFYLAVFTVVVGFCRAGIYGNYTVSYPGFLAVFPLSGWLDYFDAAPNVVDLGYIKYKGNLSYDDTVAYLGVPYAEPPLGELRWRKPLSLNTTRVAQEAKNEVVDLTEYPDFCIQGSTGDHDAGGAGTEDCLKMNVYAPAGAKKGDDLPVLFYIHGGAHVFGNPRNWPFDHWVHQSPNVVIVSIYYRLDSLGFLAAPELMSEGVGDANVALYDQIEALKWVQKHIDAFGGDPGKVTINGQSASARSVELHLLAKESRGLFSQAIVQSVFRTPMPTLEQQKPMFDYYADQAGCLSHSAKETMACLRGVDVGVLSRAQDAVMYNFTGPYAAFRPVLDKVLFDEYPTISILRGNLADVPILVGATSNETLSGGTDVAAALKAFYPQLTAADIADFVQIYPLSDFVSEEQRLQVATGESEFICARHIIGAAAAKTNKVYAYRYNQPPGHAHTEVVGHAAENWMFFRGTTTGPNGTTTFQPQSDVDRAFAAELIAYWLSFVRAGDPNTYKLARSPVWPGYPARIVLQEPKNGDTTASGSEIEEEPALECARCEFVAGKAEQEQA